MGLTEGMAMSIASLTDARRACGIMTAFASGDADRPGRNRIAHLRRHVLAANRFVCALIRPSERAERGRPARFAGGSMKVLVSWLVVIVLALYVASDARAQTEITLLSPNPIEAVINKLAADFEAKTGTHV